MRDDILAAAGRLISLKACKETSQVIYGVDVARFPAVHDAARHVNSLIKADERLVLNWALAEIAVESRSDELHKARADVTDYVRQSAAST